LCLLDTVQLWTLLGVSNFVLPSFYLLYYVRLSHDSLKYNTNTTFCLFPHLHDDMSSMLIKLASLQLFWNYFLLKGLYVAGGVYNVVHMCLVGGRMDVLE